MSKQELIEKLTYMEVQEDNEFEKLRAILLKYAPAYDVEKNGGFKVSREDFIWMIDYLKKTGQVSKDYKLEKI